MRNIFRARNALTFFLSNKLIHLCIIDQIHYVFCLKFIEQSLLVGTDCLVTDTQFLGNVFVRLTNGEQLENFALPRGQLDRTFFFLDGRADFVKSFIENFFPVHDLRDGLNPNLGSLSLDM